MPSDRGSKYYGWVFLLGVTPWRLRYFRTYTNITPRPFQILSRYIRARVQLVYMSFLEYPDAKAPFGNTHAMSRDVMFSRADTTSQFELFNYFAKAGKLRQKTAIDINVSRELRPSDRRHLVFYFSLFSCTAADVVCVVSKNKIG